MSLQDRFRSFRDKWLTPWWARFFLIPGIEGGPAALAGLWFSWSALHTTLFGYGPPLVLFVAGGWQFLCGAARSSINEYAAVNIGRMIDEKDTIVREKNTLLRLIGRVRIIVGVKSDRFHQTANVQTPLSPHDVFLTITQPELQIKEIIRHTCDFFAHDGEPDENIRVSLMEWDDARRHLVFIAWYPDHEPPRALPGAFRDTTTVAGKSYLTNDIVICEDTANDVNYAKLGDRGDGSMFSYPIYDDHMNRVALIVNVVSDKIRRFRSSGRDALELPMQVFADRLLLENRLRKIKLRVSEDSSQGGGLENG
jgi:hypothetical protein